MADLIDLDGINANVIERDVINANVSNVIQKVKIETEEITVIPKTETQGIEHSVGKLINKVNVERVTADIDPNIQEDNIKVGKNILGKEGTFTKDASAKASDILQDKTAYVKGEKVTGTFIPLDTSDATATANDILAPATAYVSGEKVTGTIQVEYHTGEYNILGSILTSVAFTNPVFDLTNKCVVDWVYDQSQLTVYKYNTSYIITNTKTITFDEIGLSDQVLNSVSIAYNDIGNNTRIYISAGRKYESKSMLLAYVDIDESLEVIDYKTYVLNTNSGAISAGRISAIPHQYNKFIIQYHYSNTANTATSFSVVKEFEIVSGEFQELYSTENGYLTGSGVFRNYTGTMIFRNIFDIKYSKDGKYAILYSHYQWAAGEIRTTRIIDISSGFTVLKYWGEEKHCYFLGDKIVVDTSIYLLPNITTRIGTGTALTNAISRTLGDYVTYWVDSSNIQIIGFDESTSKTKTIKTLDATTTGVSPYTCDGYGVVYLRTRGTYVLENSITGIPNKMNVKGNILYSTLDTTAGAGDVLYPKTAYVNGNKVTGTIKNNGALNYTPSTSSQTIPTGYTSGGSIAAVTSSIDSNIAEGNIKAGVSILGVTGTYEGTGGSGEAVKGVFEGEEAELTNSIEGAVIEEFGVVGISTQDTSLNLQNVSGDIAIKVTNGTEEQTVIFPLGEQKLMKGSYLADDGIHHRRKQITLNNSNINMVSFVDEVNSIKRAGIGKTDLGWKEVWDIGVCLVDRYKEINSYDTLTSGVFATNFILGYLSIFDNRFTSLETARNLLIGTVIEIEQVNEYVIPYTTAQQTAWNKLKQLTTYAGTTTVTTTNTIKPVLSGEYYMNAPELPIVLTNVNGTLQIKLDGKNKFNANGGYDYETGTAKVTHTIVEANKIIVVNTTEGAWNRLGCNISGLKPNTEYTVSSDITNTGGLNCGFYGANNDNMFTETLTNFKGNLTVLTDSNGNLHFEFYTNFSSNITDGTVIYDNIQLEEGTEATEYEPYRKITLVDDQTATITISESNTTVISLI